MGKANFRHVLWDASFLNFSNTRPSVVLSAVRLLSLVFLYAATSCLPSSINQKSAQAWEKKKAGREGGDCLPWLLPTTPPCSCVVKIRNCHPSQWHEKVCITLKNVSSTHRLIKRGMKIGREREKKGGGVVIFFPSYLSCLVNVIGNMWPDCTCARWIFTKRRPQQSARIK